MTARAKSPYRKYHKKPHDYKFKRCAHEHTHTERHGGLYRVCDVCNTIRENLGNEMPVEVLKAA